MNRLLGWALLVAGWGWAAWLDPWSLGGRDPSTLVGSPRMAARHAQAVVLGMAFLQLAVAQLPTSPRSPLPARRAALWLTAAGAMLYTLGYALRILWPAGAGLISMGALMNLIGFAALAGAEWRSEGSAEIAILLLVISFGMAVDATMGLFALSPARFLPAYLGPDDGLRLRMLRLARAAAIALPILALLYRDLRPRGKNGRSDEIGPRRRVARWGWMGLLCGAVGMPAVLTIAAFTSVQLKYLLPIPADAVFLGTLCGTWRASREARPLEFWGWLLVVLSMFAGLLMGLYAFDGPLAAPAFLGAYNDFPRRLARLAHADCVVLGLLCIFVARELGGRHSSSASSWVGVPMLVAGTVTTLAVIAFLSVVDLPARLLSIGPALVAAGTMLCIGPINGWVGPEPTEP